MCHYCGCRHVSLIRDYIAEHERVTDLGGDAVRALDVGDLPKAEWCVQEMAVVLAAHWQGEENRELAELLATVDVSDATDQQQIRLAVTELHEHISKEEDGLFPASLTALSGRDWDEAMAAWHDAHPGAEMMSD
jgi:hypothetical protein